MPSAFLSLLKDPLTSEFCSLKYLKAGSEIFAFLIAFSWLLTFIFNHDVIDDNPLKRRIGYNNLCVGFDTPPAKYFAFFLWPVCTYFNMRFAWIEIVTEYSLDEKHTSCTGKAMTVVGSVLFVFSVLLQTFILVFPPAEGADVWIHSGFFIQYIITRLFVIATQFFKHRWDECRTDEESITSGQWTWFCIFTLASIGVPLLAFADFYYYDVYSPEPPKDTLIPWYITNAADLIWFACLGTTAKFLPAHRVYRIKAVAKAQLASVVAQ